MTAQSDPAAAGWAAARTLALAHLQRARNACEVASFRDAPAARAAVSQAVHTARAEHCSWGEIGNVLGLARGNAYQRYRTKPLTPTLDTPPP